MSEATPALTWLHAVHGGGQFQMNKKDAFLTMPNLKAEAVRKHVATLGTLGLVETVRSEKDVLLRLTSSGHRDDAKMD
jgi:hypothetical protein